MKTFIDTSNRFNFRIQLQKLHIYTSKYIWIQNTVWTAINWHLKIESISEYNIDGYRFFIKDHSNHRDGGLVLYVTIYLQPTDRTPWNINEHSCVQVNTVKKKIIHHFKPLLASLDENIEMDAIFCSNTLNHRLDKFRRLEYTPSGLEVTLRYRREIL